MALECKKSKIREKKLNKIVSITDLNYQINNKIILENINITFNINERIIIVGENGIGKSSFLKILNKEIENFEGVIHLNGKIGYLPQFFEVDKNISVFNYIVNISCKNEWDNIDSFKTLGGYELLKNLSSLGLDENILTCNFNDLSGGQKVKIHLCSLFSSEFALLLLDEPTNHLDLNGIKWLEDKINQTNQAIVMVTHDRDLINKTSSYILELNPESKNFTKFLGGYDSYLKEQNKIKNKLMLQREKQKDELSNLNLNISESKNKINAKQKKVDSAKLAFDYKKNRSQRKAGSNIKILQKKQIKLKDDLVKIPNFRKELKINFNEGIVIENLFLDVKNLKYKNLFKEISFVLKAGDKLIISGPNGSGKTTLLKIISNFIKADSGEVNFSTNNVIGFLDQDQESLNKKLLLSDFITNDSISKEMAIHLLRKFGVLNSGIENFHLSLDKLSLGNLRKAQLAKMILQKANILLLDEVTNHMDINSIEQIEDELIKFPGIIIATSHDRYFSKKIMMQEICL